MTPGRSDAGLGAGLASGLGADVGAGLGADVRIGISGWRYPPWRGDFYPASLPQRDELAYASRRLRTIEVNGSFYALQRPSSWVTWAATVPADFELTVKGGRFITHMKRLRDPMQTLPNFFAAGPLRLGERLGAFLWQLPPNLAFDPDLVRAFLAALPRTEAAAAALARGTDGRFAARTGEPAWVRAAAGRGSRALRHALEVRHASFDTAAFVDLCREHRVAVVVSDSAGAWPRFEHITADHVYVRLHGSGELYAGGYPDAELDEWADRIRAWAGHPDVRAVHVFFDNDVKVRAPYDAQALAARLGVGP